MVDRYTKAVLTIIAAALVGIFAQGIVRPASAAMDGCGNSLEPCHITNLNDLPITVRVLK